jgi:hypothetical protein
MEAVEEQAEKQERARLERGGRPMHTDSGSPGNVAAWKYLRKRAKIAGIPASKIESFGRDQDGVGGDKEGLIALLLATETTTEQWSQRLADDTLTESERSELMRLNQSGDIDRVLVCAPRLLCTPFWKCPTITFCCLLCMRCTPSETAPTARAETTSRAGAVDGPRYLAASVSAGTSLLPRGRGLARHLQPSGTAPHARSREP